MLAIDIHVPIWILALLLPFAGLTGYLFRSYQIQQKKNQIAQMEREVLDAHAQILDLQMKLSIKDQANTKAPVVPMKENASLDTRLRGPQNGNP
jgi:hypothetical protein